MLKGFVSGVEKDIKRIPMKGKNLWAITPNAQIGYNQDVGTDVLDSAGPLQVSASNGGMILTSNSSWEGTSWKIQVEVDKEYYISFDSVSQNLRITIYMADGNNKVTRRIANYTSNFPQNKELIILDNEKYIVISISLNNIATAEIIGPIISTDIIPYEPYGYQEGWEVRDNQDRLIWGRELVHYGFKIDKSVDNSESAVIYTHDAVTMTPAYMNFTNDRFDYGSWGNAFFVRDCYPVALNLDGTEAYRLDPDDYTKKTDGTASDIFYELLATEPSDWSTQWKQYYKKSGDEYVLNSQSEAPTFATDTYYKLTYSSSFTGNFMMAFPKVWFYRHEDSQYNYIEISNHKLSDDWKCYSHINANGQEVDFIYLPLFKGVIKDSKLRSLPGQIPQGDTNATIEVNAATALGSRWQIWDHSSVECINDLLTLMSKSIDSQGQFGKGRESGYNSTDTVTYGKLQTGTLIKRGKFHGFSSSYKEVKVFGLEGFWANRWDRLQGMLLVNNVWKIKMTPPYNFTGTDFITLSNAEVPSGIGYLSKVQTSEYGSIPASIANGSSSKYFKDYFYKNATDTRVAIRGGYCGGGAGCGFRYVSVNYTASSSGWNLGASPVYK